MGMGRAGGYAGYDDDEFEELGGTSGPSRSMRGTAGGQPSGRDKIRSKGFEIGAALEDRATEEESGLFSTKEISLQPSTADVRASDFMTAEEEEALKAKKNKNKKKDTEFGKKKKKKKKKHVSRKTVVEDDKDGDTETKSSLLEDLQQTAVVNAVTKKRRRTEDDDEAVSGGENTSFGHGDTVASVKRARYDAVMAKGNARTKALFVSRKPLPQAMDDDEEPDDAFLDIALTKARRLNQLKEMTKKKGAEAVVASLQQLGSEQPEAITSSFNTVAFAVDETREFTRALQAREAQKQRKKPDDKKEDRTPKVEPKVETVKEEGPNPSENDEDLIMEELAKEVKEEDVPSNAGLDGTTGTDVNLGRGLAGMLGLLQSSGELSRKNAGKEEMQGRARDERTYEDYEELDLSKIVKLDERTATEKDKEMSKKQIKLEYRDKHGRLQTRRDAFRDMSQQFHGFKGGKNKRKEERKLKQIEREQKQKEAGSRQAGEGGILGALRATQQATGKAYISHKT